VQGFFLGHGIRPRLGLPISSSETREDDEVDRNGDLRHLEMEFSRLCDASVENGGRNKQYVCTSDVLGWSEIRALIADELLTTDEMMGILEDTLEANQGEEKGKITLAQFVDINRAIDELLDDLNLNDDLEAGAMAGGVPVSVDDSELVQGGQGFGTGPSGSGGTGQQQQQQYLALSSVDAWDPEVDVATVYDAPFLTYLRSFYSKHADETGLAYDDFKGWKDVQDMLMDGSMDALCLQEVWFEALQYSSKEGWPEDGRVCMDTFFRLCIRLDQLADEIEAALKNLTDVEIHEYYAGAFRSLLGAEHEAEALLSFDELIRWPDLAGLIREGMVSIPALRAMWEAAPKRERDCDGQMCIRLETFTALMGAMDDDIHEEKM
jgi:hypothetical protein